MTELEWLEDWYASRCDGDSEHQFGVELCTVDNPGWGLRVELTGTSHEGLSRAWEKMERTEQDWIHWSVSANRFIGYCGARNLKELFAIARNYLEAEPASLRPAEVFRGSLREGLPWRSVIHDPRENGALHYQPED